MPVEEQVDCQATLHEVPELAMAKGAARSNQHGEYFRLETLFKRRLSDCNILHSKFKCEESELKLYSYFTALSYLRFSAPPAPLPLQIGTKVICELCAFLRVVRKVIV